MNLITLLERENYLKALKAEIKKRSNFDNHDIVLCVPFVHLDFFSKNLSKTKIGLGAQNIFWEERGSFTGEISPIMIRECGAKYAIIGHSERRKYFRESNQMTNMKVRAAIRNQIVPILCVGESEDERKNGEIKDVITQQVLGGLDGVLPMQAENIIIAYEPIWAVGTDVEPTSDEIMEVRILIRKILIQKYGTEVDNKVRILYGGSVKAKAIKKMCLDPQMDGVLVGRESLVPSNFLDIASEFSCAEEKGV